MADGDDVRLKQLHGKLGGLVYQFARVHFAPAPDKWAPPINAYRCPLGFSICVDIAGINKEELHLEVEADRIRLQGTRELPEPKGKEQAAKQILTMEIDAGPFEREITLPSEIETGAVRAEYRDGFLWIFLPFRSES